jgi:hypothetical protein
MNERIKELVDQILPNEKEWHKGDPKDWGYFFSNDELEKFAELLINECAETVQDFVDHRFPASEYPVRLRRYFGVEE